jgi:syntaxin 18
MQIGPSRFQPRPSRQPTNLAQSLLTGQEITSLTDKERDEIDFEAKSIIRQTMDRVKAMENLEQGDFPQRNSRLCLERRSRTEKTGFLARYMVSSEEEMRNMLLSTHRGAITWYLSKQLSKASDIQRNQQEVRLMREVEKSKRYTLLEEDV